MLNYGYANTVFGNIRTGGKLTYQRVTCEKCGQFTLVQGTFVSGIVVSVVCSNPKCWEEK